MFVLILTIEYSEIALVLRIGSTLVAPTALSFIKGSQVVEWLTQRLTWDSYIKKWVLHHSMVVDIWVEAHGDGCLRVESLLLDSISLVSHGCLEGGRWRLLEVRELVVALVVQCLVISRQVRRSRSCAMVRSGVNRASFRTPAGHISDLFDAVSYFVTMLTFEGCLINGWLLEPLRILLYLIHLHLDLRIFTIDFLLLLVLQISIRLGLLLGEIVEGHGGGWVAVLLLV